LEPLEANYDSAFYYFEKALIISEEFGDKLGTANSYNHIADACFHQKKYAKAKNAGEKALQLATDAGLLEGMRDATENLYLIALETNDFEAGLTNYQLFIEMRDSLVNAENQKGILRQSLQYQYEKEQLADKLKIEQQKAESIVKDERLQKEAYWRWSLFVGLGLVALFGFFMYQRYRITSEQNRIIEAQKAEVERQKQLVDHKNKEITDSINYAERIQSAILPPLSTIASAFRESFVFFRPRDVVSGDFYWMEEVGDAIVFAVADCTGHGVPGALVSVVCHNALNRAVREFGHTAPDEILNTTRQLVIETFEKESKVRDGMDISLITYYPKKGIIQWAGANNPLAIVSSTDFTKHGALQQMTNESNSLYEFKPNSEPIGNYFKMSSFQMHEFPVQKGDVLYLYSDGIVDQFGGPKGKKFLPRRLRELLLKQSSKSMTEQHNNIQLGFEQWRGTKSQIDDVCLIGIRI